MAPAHLKLSPRDAASASRPLLNTGPAQMATTTLKVGGMTCGACTSSVESGFKGVEGIGNVSVSLVMERAVVTHDPQKIAAEKIQEIIEDRGFEAEVLATDLPSPIFSTNRYVSDDDDEDEDDDISGHSMTTTTIAIEGMTCGACTSAVEGGFEAVPGVKHFSISLLSERAVIEHDTSLLSAAQIAEIIEDRGFGATILNSQKSTSTARPQKGTAAKKQKVVTTTVAIEGMTCGACTSAVDGGFKDVDGVLQFNISLLAERAVIVHDPTKLSPEKIAEIIEDRGFDAKIISSVQTASDSMTAGTATLQFKIFGVNDASVASALESKLCLLSGVINATLDLATSRLAISIQSTVGIRTIVEFIEAQGYNALVADNEDNNAQLESLAKTKEITEWRRAFQISLALSFPVFLVCMIFPMMFPFLDFGKTVVFPGLYLGDILCLTLTIPVQFGIGKRFYVSAYKSMKHHAPTMDVLVVLGTSAAFFFSVAAMVVSILLPPHSRPSTLFDTSGMLITFITLGRFLENRAKGQTSTALSRLMSLAPSMATIYADPIAAEKSAEGWDRAVDPGEKTDSAHEGNAVEEKVIPTELLEVGDIVLLRPGDKIPADGVVTRGETYADESMVTGEAMPVQKRKGSSVIAGTVNGAGRADFRVTRAGRDTQLSQIVKLVQNAQTTRAPIQRLADIIAGYFVPTILFLGLLTFVTWIILSHTLTTPPKIFEDGASGGKFMVCVKLCISVIVFACPCALGLATPTAVMVGTGVGAENGILVKSGAALETATRITQVVFDKTGTLTVGKMSVSESTIVSVWDSSDWRRRLWWTIVGLAEMGSEHPIGKAILHSAKEELGLGIDGTLDGSIGDFVATVGNGISAFVEPATGAERTRYRVLIGNARFLQNNKITIPQADLDSSEAQVGGSKTSSAGTTNIFVAVDGSYAGHLSLSDTVKDTARATVAALTRMNIKCAIVTGDQRSTALAVARSVGIDSEHVYAGVTPDQKQDIIRKLQEKGECVGMVGDGINDSPALATANIGIAMASGTDVAMEAADIVLMRPNDLMDVPASIQLARSIFNRIKLNLAWACAYNVVGLPFAMGVFLPFGMHLHPMAAGAAMAASSVSVVVSSLLLRFWKRPRWMEDALAEEKGQLRRKGTGWAMGGLVGKVTDIIHGLSGKKKQQEDGYVPLNNLDAV
ncbi:hypothetical protein B7463_g2021, partial [Scytalidium lignicola]